uniref:Nuclear pore complex protein Nup153 n=1 Tax=Eptatretus burgeri TaxID=7764 RepID=A0A8C4R8A8_EPTBU
MCLCFVFTGCPDTLPPAPCVGFGEQFKKAPGTWDCDVCLVQNKPDAPVCVACSSSRPGSKAPSTITGIITNVTPTTSLSFGDKFKKAPGTWDCDVCLVQNKPDTLACVACTSPKPGSKPPPVQQAPLKSEPPQSHFKFGILSDTALPTINVDTFKSSKSGDFKFGLHSKTQTETSTFSSPFHFGEQTSSLVIPTNGKANEVHIGTALGSLTKPANDGGTVKTGFPEIGKSTDLEEPASITAVKPIQPVYSGFGSQSKVSASVANSLGATEPQPAFGLTEAFTFGTTEASSRVGFCGAGQSLAQPPAFGSQQPSVGVPTFGQVSSQTPAFGSLGQPSQPAAFSLPANQAPSFGGGQPSLFGPSATSNQQSAFGSSNNPALGAGSGFQFNLNSAPSFNFGAAAASTVPVAPRGFSFGGAAVPPSNQPTHSFQFNATPNFNIGGGSNPVPQFPTSGGSTIKNRNIKKAVRRRK